MIVGTKIAAELGGYAEVFSLFGTGISSNLAPRWAGAVVICRSSQKAVPQYPMRHTVPGLVCGTADLGSRNTVGSPGNSRFRGAPSLQRQQLSQPQTLAMGVI